MRNLIKRVKGFTLVELMIVIAIIGVLAIVLIPQASKMRTNAKLAGVQSNMRIADAQVEGIIADANDPTSFSNMLQARTDGMVRNPMNTTISDSIIATTTTSGSITTSMHGIVIYNPVSAFTDKPSADKVFSFDSNDPSKFSNANAAGDVIVAPYGAGGGVDGVAIYGYDDVGNPMTTTSEAPDIQK